jgi:hypothetical protein
LADSLVFAALLATATLILSFPRGASGFSRLSLWSYFFLSTASHGLLDAMTDGGLGIAFFRSTTVVTFCPGRPFMSRRSVSGVFSPLAAWRSLRASFSGFGFQLCCSSLLSGSSDAIVAPRLIRSTSPVSSLFFFTPPVG